MKCVEEGGAILSKGKPIARSRGPAKAGAKAGPGASKAKPAKARKGAVSATMKSHEQATGEPASRLIDQRIRDLGG